MSINAKMLDRLLAAYADKGKEKQMEENGLLKQFAREILEQAIQSEIVQLRSDDKHNPTTNEEHSRREGAPSRPIVGNFGKRGADKAPERGRGVAPLNIARRKSPPVDTNQKIISHHVRGMTTEEIREHLKNTNDIDVPAATIAALTAAVVNEVRIWQNRPLELIYPLVYVDAVRVRMRENGKIVNKMVYLLFAVSIEGIKDVLGMWVADNEDVELWTSMLTDLKSRGVHDIFILCANDLKGFPEVCATVYPDTEVELYIGQMVRNCLKFVSWKERKEVHTAIKTVYQAATVEQAGSELAAFATKWDKTHPSIGQYWRANWERFSQLFAYPADIRKVIYTTNTMESLHTVLCNAAKDRRAFPDNALMLQLLYLTMNSVIGRWSMPVRDWKAALNRFSLLFSDRMPRY